jgi:spore germination protein KC
MGKQIWKKMFLIVFIISIGLTMSGCWDYQEINNVTNVAGIALDKGEEKKFKLTSRNHCFQTIGRLQYFGQTGGKPKGIRFSKGLGMLVAVAANVCISAIAKLSFFSEEIAKEGIKEHLDFFVRDHDLRMTLLVFVAKGVEARETLKDTALNHQIDRMNGTLGQERRKIFFPFQS